MSQSRNTGAKPGELASLRRLSRMCAKTSGTSRRAANRAFDFSLSPNRSCVSPGEPALLLVGRCWKLYLQQDALSFTHMLTGALNRLHSYAAARERQPATESIAKLPAQSRAVDQSRSYRDPRHRAAAPPASCRRTRLGAGAVMTVPVRVQKSGASAGPAAEASLIFLESKTRCFDYEIVIGGITIGLLAR